VSTCPNTTIAPLTATVEPCGWRPDPLCAPTFIYNGSAYQGCTTTNNLGKGWCSYDDIYAGRFSECVSTCPNTTIAPLTATVEPCGWRPDPLCAPTFIYNGSAYQGCTTTNNLGNGWCSYDNIYAGRFSDCVNTCPTTTTAEPCGWRPQPLCAPTFEYNGSTYQGCTTANNSGKGWCSHDDVYAGRFSDCVSTCLQEKGNTTSGVVQDSPATEFCGWLAAQSCVPEFSYNNKSYTTCTTAGHGDTPWCSLDAFYSGRRKNCTRYCVLGRVPTIAPMTTLAPTTTTSSPPNATASVPLGTEPRAVLFLVNARSFGNVIVKVSGSRRQYDAYAFSKRSVVRSITLQTDQTDASIRFGLTANSRDDCNFSNGHFVGLYPNGRLYVPGRMVNDTYLVTDEITLAVGSMRMSVYKNDELIHSWTDTPEQGMYVQIFLRDLASSVEIKSLAIEESAEGGGEVSEAEIIYNRGLADANDSGNASNASNASNVSGPTNETLGQLVRKIKELNETIARMEEDKRESDSAWTGFIWWWDLFACIAVVALFVAAIVACQRWCAHT